MIGVTIDSQHVDGANRMYVRIWKKSYMPAISHLEIILSVVYFSSIYMYVGNWAYKYISWSQCGATEHHVHIQQ